VGWPGNAAESSGSNDQCLREYTYINEPSEEARLGKGSNEIKEGESPNDATPRNKNRGVLASCKSGYDCKWHQLMLL